MRKYLMLGAAVAALSLSGPAQARDGWYVGLEAGLGSVDKTDAPYDDRCDNNYESRCIKSIVIVGLGSEISFDDGLAGFLTVGRGIGRRWRIEGELGYRSNETDWYGGGKLRETSWMVNALYDSPFAERWTFSVGAGIGIDDAEYKDALGFSDDSSSFAAQGIAGLTYRLNDRWDAMANFRYLWVNEASFSTPLVDGDVDLRKQSVTVGLRYGFGQPEPQVRVASAPPAPVPNQFIIFFGFDKCNITPAADTVLSEAAAAAKSLGSATVSIVGHTDTMGSTAYNARLSECRSRAAGDNLVSKGVPRSAIATSGAGEAQLLIKTGDSVKEPQNRRAVIDVE